MSRINIGDSFTVTYTVTSRSTGLPADADDFTVLYMEGGRYGTQVEVTPTRVSLGTYSVGITPTKAGYLYHRGDTDGDFDVAGEDVVSVAESVFTV